MGNILNIDRLTADAIDLLKEMIAIPSPSFEEETVCSHLCSWLEVKGIVHQRKGNNIIAEHITSVILSANDEHTLKKLGINLTCDPAYETKRLYHG